MLNILHPLAPEMLSTPVGCMQYSLHFSQEETEGLSDVPQVASPVCASQSQLCLSVCIAHTLWSAAAGISEDIRVRLLQRPAHLG